jgi:hypothetical protein
MLPNHLGDLTFWNFEQVGEVQDHYDFWEHPVSAADLKYRYFGGVKIIYPNYIGFHGVPTTFKREHVGLFESYGKPVEVESLYEAQLSLRLGDAPNWIEEAKAEWSQIRAMHQDCAR